MTFDWFWLFPVIIVVVIIIFVHKSVKKVKEKIERKLGPAPSEMAMKQLLDQIKSRDLPQCPRCNGQTIAMLETDASYKCESCDYEFQGAPHI